MSLMRSLFALLVSPLMSEPRKALIPRLYLVLSIARNTFGLVFQCLCSTVYEVQYYTKDVWLTLPGNGIL